MLDLEGITRRELIKSGIFALIGSQIPDFLFAQPTARSVFSRNKPYNIDALSEFMVSGTEISHNLTNQEYQRDITDIINKPQMKGVKIVGIQVVKSTEHAWVKFEPDEKYAEGLIREAKIAIKHFFGFLGLQDQSGKIYFKVPKTVSEIDYHGNPNTIYLVAGIGTKVTTIYNAKTNIGNMTATREFRDSNAGETKRDVEIFNSGTSVEFRGYKQRPIFYNLAYKIADRSVYLAESPAIEVLHNYLWSYATRHIQKRLKGISPTYQAVRDVLNEEIQREERLVHALSILWWPHYNKDRNLGFTAEELSRRFKVYDSAAEYSGVIELSQRIAKIGVSKAIILYMTNPEKLFSGLP